MKRFDKMLAGVANELFSRTCPLFVNQSMVPYFMNVATADGQPESQIAIDLLKVLPCFSLITGNCQILA